MLVGNVSQRNLMYTIVSKETDIDLITLRQLRIKKSQLFLLKRDNSIFNILLTISSLKKSSRSIIPVCFFWMDWSEGLERVLMWFAGDSNKGILRSRLRCVALVQKKLIPNLIFMSDWELGWWFKWIKERFALLLVRVPEMSHHALINSDLGRLNVYSDCCIVSRSRGCGFEVQ